MSIAIHGPWPWLLALLLLFGGSLDVTGMAATGAEVQARIDADLEAGQPVVVHVVVALCDNKNQGIVPVPERLGNGQDPRQNLYWGAMYGVSSFFRRAGWNELEAAPSPRQAVLSRAVFQASIERQGRAVPVFVVADAWDGAEIRPALARFLEMAAGAAVESVEAGQGPERVRLTAGGAAHLVAYVGHNGLMEFTLPRQEGRADSPARAAVVLACASRPDFDDRLRAAGAHPLLLTTGLMAPEAYTLDAAIRAWVGSRTTVAVVEAAARAYDRYQKCGREGARRLFWGER